MCRISVCFALTCVASAICTDETFKKSVRLDERFKFEDGESYLIKCTYQLSLIDPANESRILWSDHAVGTCTVLIRTK